MKNFLRKPGFGVAIAVIAAFSMMGACKKDNSASNPAIPANKQKVSLYLSDDPGYFDKVFLDIRKVEVLVDTCGGTDDNGWNDKDRCWWDEDHRNDRNKPDTCQVWDSLGINPGV